MAKKDWIDTPARTRPAAYLEGPPARRGRMHHRRFARHRPGQGCAGRPSSPARTISTCPSRSSSRPSPATGRRTPTLGLFVERDMILKPDMSTASAAPWTGGLDPAGDPRRLSTGTADPIRSGAAQRAEARGPRSTRTQGWTPVVAPEMEFYLVARNLDPAKSDRADDGALRPACRRPPGLFDDRGRRVRAR